MPICLYVYHMHAVPSRDRKMHASHGTGVTGGCVINSWDPILVLCRIIRYCELLSHLASISLIW